MTGDSARTRLVAKELERRFGGRFDRRRLQDLNRVIGKWAAERGEEDLDSILHLVSSASPDDLLHLINAGTVPESYLFRDQRQMDLLRSRVLPAIISRKTRRGEHSIRVWSAACSRGQEVATLGILIDQALAAHTDWHVELVGTDIHADRIRQAREGVFTGRDLRRTTAQTTQQYFTPDGDRYRLDPAIQARCDYRVLNLLDREAIAALGRFDLILCRNVLIYFDRKACETAVDGLSKNLKTDGYLLLGHAEWFLTPPKSLRLEGDDDGHYLRPATFGPGSHSGPTVVDELPQITRHTTTVGSATTAADAEFPARASAMPKSAPTPRTTTVPTPTTRTDSEPHPGVTPGLSETIKSTPPASTQAASSMSLPDRLARVTAAAEAEDWDEALSLTNGDTRYASPDAQVGEILGYRVIALNALGRLEEGLALLDDLVVSRQTDPSVHYLYGLILREADPRSAAVSLRRARYLQPDLVEATLYLGMIAGEQGNGAVAMRYFRTAALRLAAKAQDERVLFDPRITFGQLRAWVESQLV